jgi:GNAT superfamily N-acetyltransferase
MSEFRIDKARSDDIPALVFLLGELFSIERDFAPEPTRQARGLLLLLQATDRATVQVARDDAGRPVGMATAQLVISSAEGAPSAWIEDVIVASYARGRGVGRALLEAVLGWAREHGATRAQLLVDLDNPPALEFYQHLNWEITRLGMRRIYLRSNT